MLLQQALSSSEYLFPMLLPLLVRNKKLSTLKESNQSIESVENKVSYSSSESTVLSSDSSDEPHEFDLDVPAFLREIK